jgi:hypothetical protein
VVVFRGAIIAGLLALMVTLGSVPPEASVTTPRICPVIATWLNRDDDPTLRMNSRRTIFFAMTSPFVKTVMQMVDEAMMDSQSYFNF